MTLPPATAAGKPEKTSYDPASPERVAVEVKIHYMIGNHDWFYHLPGAAYNRIRQKVVDTLGLAHPGNQIFPHEIAESPELREICRQHQVFVRHGDIYDGFNFEGDRDASSLGDCIVVELLNRFPAEVDRQIGNALPQATRNQLRELDNVRPLIVVPVWINGVLEQTCENPALKRRVKELWDKLVDDFLKNPYVRRRDKWWNPSDLVDKLEAALKFSQGISLGTASKVLGWVNDKFGSKPDRIYEHALKEKAFRSRTARFFVYGHTHHQEIVPLDLSTPEDSQDSIQHIYFNTGTWRRVHAPTKFDPSEQEFASFNVMTYLAFFKEDERKGRRFEHWNGSLGI